MFIFPSISPLFILCLCLFLFFFFYFFPPTTKKILLNFSLHFTPFFFSSFTFSLQLTISPFYLPLFCSLFFFFFFPSLFFLLTFKNVLTKILTHTEEKCWHTLKQIKRGEGSKNLIRIKKELSIIHLFILKKWFCFI